jgi:hypothetical protein
MGGCRVSVAIQPRDQADAARTRMPAPRDLRCWGPHADSRISCRPLRMEECSWVNGSSVGTRVAGRTMTLRQLDVPASEWRVEDMTAVRKVLADVGADPAMARAWRGSVVLSFAEVQEIHPYLNPAIVAFLQNLYSEFPYLLYFLNPDRARGALDSFFASIGALCQTQDGVWVMWSDDVATAYYGALTAAAEFAVNRGDDWVAVVEGYEKRQSILEEIRANLITSEVLEA